MTRCYVSEQIAKHCNEPEEAECPECYGVMTEDEYCNLVCYSCGGVVCAPGDDDF